MARWTSKARCPVLFVALICLCWLIIKPCVANWQFVSQRWKVAGCTGTVRKTGLETGLVNYVPRDFLEVIVSWLGRTSKNKCSQAIVILLRGCVKELQPAPDATRASGSVMVEPTAWIRVAIRKIHVYWSVLECYSAQGDASLGFPPPI